MIRFRYLLSPLFLLLNFSAGWSQESVWMEAEHFQGIKGYCWPMGRPEMKKTQGNWGLSGPGWASEWAQGGESGFLSIACGADDDQAVVSQEITVPGDATKYQLWVRYRDNRGSGSRFNVRITDASKKPITLTFGSKPVIEEDNEQKLYWNWAFAWEGQTVNCSPGKVKIEILSAFKEKECRQIDCLVLTSDVTYRPLIKERPKHPTWELLNEFTGGKFSKVQPLSASKKEAAVSELWKPQTFQNKGFLYLWNMSHTQWASDDPKRVPFPYQIGDKETREAFEKKYAGAKEVPIFSDSRIVPIFLGPAPYQLEGDKIDPKDPKKMTPIPEGKNFLRWLEANPDRAFGTLLNYQPDKPISEAGKKELKKNRERFVGGVAGENLGYFNIPLQDLKATMEKAKTRREIAEGITLLAKKANDQKYKTVYGEDWPDSFREVIPCQSIGMTAFAPLSYTWGCRTVGYESSAITSGLMPMRMAFLRGAARQNHGLTATYRSCNFGDSATIFSEQSSYTKPKNILDNYYSVFSGAGMTWYKMDIWYQYLAGSSMFYHEQGFDEFWMPGGTTAAGQHEVQLSPKGKLVDRFLKVTKQHPDRGTPYTPIAFLVDYAHGWDATTYSPHSFDNFAQIPERTLYGDHEQMMQQYFWTAYHPIITKSMEPTTATSEVFVPGVFGDIFDVVYAYPDLKKWTTLSTYPVVIATGEIELTQEEGKRLARYVEEGGTLLVADEHLTGPGLVELKLPKLGAAQESRDFNWLPTKKVQLSQQFRFRPIEEGTPLATTGKEAKVCCASLERGKGKLIVMSIPRGMGIDRTAHPLLPLLIASLRENLLPIHVEGDVEWTLNRTETGWLVGLFNPAGAIKPQQGIFPTDYRENRPVVIRSSQPVGEASDWLFPEEKLTYKERKQPQLGFGVELTVQAGSVRIVELKRK